MAIVYTLFKDKDSNELHLYKGKKIPDNCTADKLSVCSQANRDNSEGGYVFKCKNEAEARLECAKLGRKVCANCVKNLYETIQ